MTLVPLTTFRASSNRAWLLEEPGKRWLVKVYEGADAEQRRECEVRRLALWSHHGFRVPELAGHSVSALGDAFHLVMEYVPAPTLQEVLKQSSTGPVGFGWLEQVFTVNRRRHDLAYQLREPGLLHHDPNTSNILCPAGEDCCFIDFEAEVPCWHSEFIGMEIAKLFRWAARDLGRSELNAAAARVVKAYAGREDWLRVIVHRTCGRPFQFFHRWQDTRRKATKPDEVTKYDVVDALARYL